jgi:ribosomal protein L12E/L44/L45/RPP1/RPP2
MKDPNEPSAAKIKALIEEQKKKKMDEMMQKAAARPAKYPDDAKAQAKKQLPAGYAKGGRVRGVGCARKGHGRGTMR